MLYTLHEFQIGRGDNDLSTGQTQQEKLVLANFIHTAWTEAYTTHWCTMTITSLTVFPCFRAGGHSLYPWIEQDWVPGLQVSTTHALCTRSGNISISIID